MTDTVGNFSTFRLHSDEHHSVTKTVFNAYCIPEDYITLPLFGLLSMQIQPDFLARSCYFFIKLTCQKVE